MESFNFRQLTYHTYTGCRAPEFKNIFGRENISGRPVERPRRWWIDAVHQDVREELGDRRWRREAEDRKSWKRLIEEARVRFGL
jgi:hypothetical protein